MKKLLSLFVLVLLTMFSTNAWADVDLTAYETQVEPQGGGYYVCAIPEDNSTIAQVQLFAETDLGGGIYGLDLTSSCLTDKDSWALWLTEGSKVTITAIPGVTGGYTVTGSVTDEDGTKYNFNFTTEKDPATGIKNVKTNETNNDTPANNSKRIENGRVVIMKNGVKYTTAGTDIK